VIELTVPKVAAFQIGDTFIPKKMEMTAGTTAPPLLLSESDLIAEMDKNGIGTDATIAQHISTIQVQILPLVLSSSSAFSSLPILQERNYAFKNDQQRFVPTDRGESTSSALPPSSRQMQGSVSLKGTTTWGINSTSPSSELPWSKIVKRL
jgi:DNA topoisomerase IA